MWWRRARRVDPAGPGPPSWTTGPSRPSASSARPSRPPSEPGVTSTRSTSLPAHRPAARRGVDLLREAGHAELADRLERELVGRNVIEGRWTFQIVEEYDDTYWSLFRALEQEARDQLTDGRRHLHEARMKEERRTHGHPDHTDGPKGSPTPRPAATR